MPAASIKFGTTCGNASAVLINEGKLPERMLNCAVSTKVANSGTRLSDKPELQPIDGLDGTVRRPPRRRLYSRVSRDRRIISASVHEHSKLSRSGRKRSTCNGQRPLSALGLSAKTSVTLTRYASLKPFKRNDSRSESSTRLDQQKPHLQS